MIRGGLLWPVLWLVPAVLLTGGVVHAAPDNRPVAPPPDATGARIQSVAVDRRRVVGILEVRVDGVPDEVKESFQRGLEERLDTKHYRLASRARMKQLMMTSTTWTEGCLVGKCLTEVREKAGAELVLLAALTGSGTSFGYVVTLVRTDSGRVLQQESGRCDVCTVSEAMAKATQATARLLANVPDRLPDEAAEQSAALSRAVGKVEHEFAAHDRHASRIGTAVMAVGLAAAAGGLALYLVADRPSYAAMTAVGGGALAAGGMIVLTF